MKLQTTLFIAAAWLAFVLSGCNGKKASTAKNEREANAVATYIAPGEKDEYYLFYSGGHSGQIYVAGIPSMRHISTIPVFGKYPATGYGFDEETKHMLGGYDWGDVHHPALSQTDSKYDGRWLFCNDNANNRVARIDLRDFKTKQILGPLPNSSGSHASSFVTENTEYLFVATRFSIPLPKGRVADPKEYEKEYNGMLTGIKVDPTTGELSVAFQVKMPPLDFDLASTGKGPSSGFVFFNSYNTEMAGELLEVNASQKDRDLGVILNWKAAAQAVAEGKAEQMDGVPVLDPAKVPGIVWHLEIGKSPHGMDVDPTGKWLVAGGKLQPSTTVVNTEKMKAAIEKRDFQGDFRGVPVLKYESIVEGEVPVGLGPLHTQYDGKGNAYTSMFIDSNITKWKLPPWSDEEKKDLTKVVLDKCPVHFSVGHLVVAGSDTREPYGKWLVSMNKLSKGRHVVVGPSQPESSQLIDISGEKMRMVAEAYTEPEPHFAQILKVSDVKPIEVYPKDESKHPGAVWDMAQAGVTREGNKVTAKVIAVRSRFVPDRIDAQVGDELTVHVTNIEQTGDMIHGFGVNEHNINLIMDPGETRTMKTTVNKPGVYPFYCTNFCSALHQEMQGYLIVKPAALP
ncbi:MAG TPA: Sec-dependent nitrous-oxide reductase [Chthoniobacteraceae bacterium]|jgi:nitrous-oxide reductase|nr:Sec-dependent nitrous-oxide reductase [Chthoniobacteraceae bacterium]